jgi:hypothetical protein
MKNHDTSEEKISEETERILRALPDLQFSKYVNPKALNETAKILQKLPKLEFPINSLGEFIEKLGGPNKLFVIEGKEFNAIMARLFPVNYFPIASAENLVEKMANLIISQRETEWQNPVCCTYQVDDTRTVSYTMEGICPNYYNGMRLVSDQQGECGGGGYGI